MVGQVLGVAVAGPVLLAHLHGPMRSGFTAASPPAPCVLAGTGYAVLLLGVLATGGRAAATPAAPPPRLPPGPGAGAPPGRCWRTCRAHARTLLPVPSWLRALTGTGKTQASPPANGGRH